MEKSYDTKSSIDPVVCGASSGNGEIDYKLIETGSLYRVIPFGYSPKRMSTRLGPRGTQRLCSLIGGACIWVSAYNLVSFGSVLGNPILVSMLGLGQGSSHHIAAKQGGMVCLNPLGMIIGALLGGILSNNLGRTKAISLGLCISVLGASLQTSSQNIEWLCIVRVLNGMGVGITDSIVPSWIAELSATGVRSGAVALELVYAGVGVCSAYWIAYGFGFVNNVQLAWRFPVGFQMLGTVLIFSVIHFLPESPRWLVSTGRSDEALEILEFLHGNELASKEIRAIQDSCHEQKASGSSLTYGSMLFGKHNHRRRIAITMIIQFTATFVVAYGMILSYAATVFGFAGYSGNKIALIAGGNSITYPFFFLVGVFYADKVGGRNLLLMGAIGCGVMMCIIGAISKVIIKTSGDTSHLGAGLVFCMYVYAAFHGASFATMGWVIPIEIFPQASRSRGGAIAVATFAFGNGLSTMLAPYLFSSIHENVFFLFGGLVLLSFPILYCLVPQTAGRSLEELNVLLSGPWLYWRAEAFYKIAMSNEAY